EHFKVGKKCMKLGHFFEKSYVSLEKCLQSQIFMHSLVSIMEQEYRKVNKIEHTLVLNKPALLKGLYAELLIDFLFDEKKVTEIYLANFLKIYMQFNKKCKEGQHNPRKAKTPFSKWYTKGYLSKNNKNIRYEDIIDDEEFNDTEELEQTNANDNEDNKSDDQQNDTEIQTIDEADQQKNDRQLEKERNRKIKREKAKNKKKEKRRQQRIKNKKKIKKKLLLNQIILIMSRETKK